jgi:hypothetical protein
MDTLTLDTLRTLAKAREMDLTDEELRGLLPLVQGVHALMKSLRHAPLEEIEPSSQYRIL